LFIFLHYKIRENFEQNNINTNDKKAKIGQINEPTQANYDPTSLIQSNYEPTQTNYEPSSLIQANYEPTTLIQETYEPTSLTQSTYEPIPSNEAVDNPFANLSVDISSNSMM
jgi:hypothetical protein